MSLIRQLSLLGASSCLLLMGCSPLHMFRVSFDTIELAGVMPYVNHPVRVSIIDAETNQPISDAHISATVRQLTYFDFGRLTSIGAKTKGTTNENGVTWLYCDTGRLIFGMQAEAEGYQSTRTGGGVLSADLNTEMESFPSSWVRLTPYRQLTLKMYKNPPAHFVFVLPKDFHGPIVIKKADGSHVTAPKGKREFIYTLTENRVITVRELALFPNNVERLNAQFENEVNLPVKELFLYELEEKKSDPIAMWRVGRLQDDDAVIFYVGRYSEADQFADEWEKRFEEGDNKVMDWINKYQSNHKAE